MVSFWSIAECTYFCFTILQFVQAIGMVLECYLGEIVGTCYPEDTLIGKKMLADYRNTVVARRVAPQEIRYQFAGFAVEVAEGSSIRHNP